MTPLPPTPSGHGTQTLLPAQMCVDALVAKGGNIFLAAEALGTTEQVMTASIAADPTAKASLDAQLNTMATLMTFDALRQAKVMLHSMVTELNPADFVKFYMDLTKAFQTASSAASTVSGAGANGATNPNQLDAHVMSMLPPHVRRALGVLKNGGGDGTPGGIVRSPILDGDDDTGEETAA